MSRGAEWMEGAFSARLFIKENKKPEEQIPPSAVQECGRIVLAPVVELADPRSVWPRGRMCAVARQKLIGHGQEGPCARAKSAVGKCHR